VADFEDARRIASTLPETMAAGTHIGVRRGSKIRGIAWHWNERIHPRKPRVPNPGVLAVRVASNEEKEIDAWRSQAPPALIRESGL